MILVRCSGCDRTCEVGDWLAGLPRVCLHCKATTVVPTPEKAPLAPTALADGNQIPAPAIAPTASPVSGNKPTDPLSPLGVAPTVSEKRDGSSALGRASEWQQASQLIAQSQEAVLTKSTVANPSEPLSELTAHDALTSSGGESLERPNAVRVPVSAPDAEHVAIAAAETGCEAVAPSPPEPNTAKTHSFPLAVPTEPLVPDRPTDRIPAPEATLAEIPVAPETTEPVAVASCDAPAHSSSDAPTILASRLQVPESAGDTRSTTAHEVAPERERPSSTRKAGGIEIPVGIGGLALMVLGTVARFAATGGRADVLARNSSILAMLAVAAGGFVLLPAGTILSLRSLRTDQTGIGRRAGGFSLVLLGLNIVQMLARLQWPQHHQRIAVAFIVVFGIWLAFFFIVARASTRLKTGIESDTAERPRSTWFADREHAPFLIGVFTAGGLLVLPWLPGLMDPVPHLTVLPVAILACLAFAVGFRRDGSVHLVRTAIAIIVFVLLVAVIWGGNVVIGCTAGGPVAITVLLLCGYTGVLLFRLLERLRTLVPDPKHLLIGGGALIVLGVGLSAVAYSYHRQAANRHGEHVQIIDAAEKTRNGTIAFVIATLIQEVGSIVAYLSLEKRGVKA